MIEIHNTPRSGIQFTVSNCCSLMFYINFSKRKYREQTKKRKKESEQQGELKLTEIRNKKMEGVPLRPRARWIPKVKVLREFCSLEEEMKMFCCKNMNRLITQQGEDM